MNQRHRLCMYNLHADLWFDEFSTKKLRCILCCCGLLSWRNDSSYITMSNISHVDSLFTWISKFEFAYFLEFQRLYTEQCILTCVMAVVAWSVTTKWSQHIELISIFGANFAVFPTDFSFISILGRFHSKSSEMFRFFRTEKFAIWLILKKYRR